MRQLSFALLLMVMSGSLMARWTGLDVSYDGMIGIYVDEATVRRAGHKVKMWHMFDYEIPQMLGSKSALSLKAQVEYDCKEEQSRFLSVTYFSKETLNKPPQNAAANSN